MRKIIRRGKLLDYEEEKDVFEIYSKRKINLQPRRKFVSVKEIAQTTARKCIKKNKCEICGKTDGKIERHHHNYFKYKDVIVLCSSCHRKIHSFDPIGW